MIFGARWTDLWASFRRNWVHSTGVQMATLVTLASAYAVVAFALVLAVNLQRALSAWGDSVQVSAYLREPEDAARTERVRIALANLPEASSVEMISKERATEAFREQMAAYAPDLLGDKEFSNPFPTSFRVRLKRESPAATDPLALEALATNIQKIDGVEDVSYGQSWVKNYATLVRIASISGWVLALILGAGALFVVGNSIRASISSRRDEIEIMELVGATARSIRAPYVFEGAAMGFFAALIATTANFAIWTWESRLVKSSFATARAAEDFGFLSPLWSIALILGGSALGAAGAYLIVRNINDGWAASGRSGAEA